MNAQPATHRPPIKAPLLLIMLIASIALPSVGSTIVIPSLPQIAKHFATDFAMVTMTQTSYMVGLAFPQLVYGAVSDRIGRRPTILTGMGLFLLGSVMAAWSPTIEVLMAGRLFQAVGGCAGIVLGRAILSDLYPREKAASSLAYITMAMAAGPMLAPLMGGLIEASFGWRAVFLVLVLVAAGVLGLCWFALPETNPPGVVKPRWSTLLAGFSTLLRNRLYRIYTFPAACLTGVYQAYLVTSSFVAAQFFPMSSVELGAWLITSVCGYSFGNFLTGRFTRKVGVDRMIRLGITINLVCVVGICMLLALDWMSLLPFFVLMALLNLGHGFMLPNSVASATSVVPGLIGSASGLMGFLQMSTSAVFSIGIGMLIETSVWFLFGGLLLISVIAQAIAMQPREPR